MGAKEILAERWGSGEWKQSQVRKTWSPLTPRSGELWLVGHREAGGKQLSHLWSTHHRCISHMAGVFGCCDTEEPPTHLSALQRNQNALCKEACSDKHLFVAAIFPTCFWFVCLHQTVLLPSAALYTLYKGNSLKKPACQILSFQCRQTTMDLTCQAVSDDNQTRQGEKMKCQCQVLALGHSQEKPSQPFLPFSQAPAQVSDQGEQCCPCSRRKTGEYQSSLFRKYPEHILSL